MDGCAKQADQWAVGFNGSYFRQTDGLCWRLNGPLLITQLTAPCTGRAVHGTGSYAKTRFPVCSPVSNHLLFCDRGIKKGKSSAPDFRSGRRRILIQAVLDPELEEK
jgi:hypothetical protein